MGESVKAVIVPTTVSLTNSQGFPVLSKRYQEFCRLFLHRKAEQDFYALTLTLTMTLTLTTTLTQRHSSSSQEARSH